jgi:hypothetical protein
MAHLPADRLIDRKRPKLHFGSHIVEAHSWAGCQLDDPTICAEARQTQSSRQAGIVGPLHDHLSAPRGQTMFGD